MVHLIYLILYLYPTLNIKENDIAKTYQSIGIITIS
jgi:hypothetical protein